MIRRSRRGIQLSPSPSVASRPQPGFDLQNAYAQHLARQAQPAYSGGSAAGQEVSTPFTRSIVNAHMAAIQAATGQSANIFTVNPGDVSADGKSFTAQGQQNADQFHAREQLAESTDEDSFQLGLNGMLNTQQQNGEAQAKQTAFGHSSPHIPESQRAIYEQMASDPNVSAHEFYGHLIQATGPAKTATARDPVDTYGKYARLYQELRKEDTGDMDKTALEVHNNALNDALNGMQKSHEQIVPPPTQRTAQPVDTVTPAYGLGDSSMFSTRPYSSRPEGGASTPAIPGMGGQPAQPQEFTAPVESLAPQAQAAAPNAPAPATQGGWRGHAEGDTLRSPSTGKTYKIVNGQPTEVK